jgi:hypothetical protein
MLAGLGLLILGVAVGRAEVALLGVPLVLMFVLGTRRLPLSATSLVWQGPGNNDDAANLAGGRLTGQLRLGGPFGSVAGGVTDGMDGGAAGGTAVQLRIASPGHQPTVVVAQIAGERVLGMALRSVRTGPSQTAS